MTRAKAAPDCSNAQTQTDMNLCSAQDLHAADVKLNQAYQALQKALMGVGDRSTKLRAAQTAWISLRDKECDFEASAVEGGSMAPLVANECLATYTAQRTAELTRLLKCQGQGC